MTEESGGESGGGSGGGGGRGDTVFSCARSGGGDVAEEICLHQTVRSVAAMPPEFSTL